MTGEDVLAATVIAIMWNLNRTQITDRPVRVPPALVFIPSPCVQNDQLSPSDAVHHRSKGLADSSASNSRYQMQAFKEKIQFIERQLLKD